VARYNTRAAYAPEPTGSSARDILLHTRELASLRLWLDLLVRDKVVACWWLACGYF
jgi:hypothetical protein